MPRKPKKDILYRLAGESDERGKLKFCVYKLDEDYNASDVYTVYQVSSNVWDCTCPSWKSPCKHVKMVQRIMNHDTNTFEWGGLYSLNRDAFIVNEVEHV